MPIDFYQWIVDEVLLPKVNDGRFARWTRFIVVHNYKSSRLNFFIEWVECVHGRFIKITIKP